DYLGGIRFRSFVAGNDMKRAMSVFFDSGLTALFDLREVDSFSCDRLIVCIDSHADQMARDALVKDLGGFG
ncbi:hypothetical protein BKA63DRAFT_417603, partial [Paraphoma chrysanthemicola]